MLTQGHNPNPSTTPSAHLDHNTQSSYIALESNSYIIIDVNIRSVYNPKVTCYLITLIISKILLEPFRQLFQDHPESKDFNV